jgi:hypothetical protein
LCAAFQMLGFESATKGDIGCRDLVPARTTEPTSKTDAGRVTDFVSPGFPRSAATAWRLAEGAKLGGAKDAADAGAVR